MVDTTNLRSRQHGVFAGGNVDYPMVALEDKINGKIVAARDLHFGDPGVVFIVNRMFRRTADAVANLWRPQVYYPELLFVAPLAVENSVVEESNHDQGKVIAIQGLTKAFAYEATDDGVVLKPISKPSKERSMFVDTNALTWEQYKQGKEVTQALLETYLYELFNRLCGAMILTAMVVKQVIYSPSWSVEVGLPQPTGFLLQAFAAHSVLGSRHYKFHIGCKSKWSEKLNMKYYGAFIDARLSEASKPKTRSPKDTLKKYVSIKSVIRDIAALRVNRSILTSQD